MRRCQKCNFESDAMLDYCWQCGTHLKGSAQFYQDAPGTHNYNQPNQSRMYNGYGQNHPNYQPRKNSYRLGRVAAVLGGFFCFLLMIGGAGVTVVYKVANRPAVPRYDDYRSRNPEPAKSPAAPEDQVSEKRRTGKATAAFEKIWVDYNVRENGRLGMRIHVKFSVYNMKGVDSQLAIYFEKADGTKMTTTNKKFASRDGQTAVYRALKPGWDDTVYKDLDLFMPYDELKLGPGKYDLKMDADVIHENGDLVEHLGYHDFTYEKK